MRYLGGAVGHKHVLDRPLQPPPSLSTASVDNGDTERESGPISTHTQTSAGSLSSQAEELPEVEMQQALDAGGSDEDDDNLPGSDEESDENSGLDDDDEAEDAEAEAEVEEGEEAGEEVAYDDDEITAMEGFAAL